MKTNTLKSKKRLFPNKGYITALAIFGYGICNAQVQNNNSIYVSDNANFYVSTGNFNFGNSPATTQTTKTASTYGVLSFGATAQAFGATDNHYLNGYARTYGTTQAILPIGANSIYAPIAVTPNANTGVDGAYYRSAASTIGTAKQANVNTISSVEYWDIRSSSANAVISLTWRASSNIAALTAGSLNNLIIIGWNGTQWVEIPSTINVTSILGTTSTYSEGSITSNSIVTLGTFSAFSLGSKVEDCSTLTASSGITKTWNGGWSPSAPTLADPVVINTAYSSGTFSCNSLVLNADVTLTDGQYAEIVNDVTGSGKIIMSSQASVVQRNSAATAPSIELTKTTRQMRRFDYIYWGTPIAGDFKSQLAGAIAHGQSVAGAFDIQYKYVSGIGGGWNVLDQTQTGRGFITRIKMQAPFLDATTQENIDMKFTGVANNGDINVPVVNNVASPNGGTSHNLLANPYPSSLDVDKFLFENEDIDGAVYLWTAATSSGSNDNVTSYTQADYAVYNFAGEINASPIGQKIAGKIASGQGFNVKALNPGSVTFTNCMRLTTGNNNFFRTANRTGEVKDRFKLNMSNAGVYSQILIAYLPQATLGYDRLYDAGRNSSSTAQLYSILETDARKLAINGRPTFFDTDVVSLGVSKNNTNAETFTISIEEKEGVFSSGEATVYLHDKALQVYHDFANGPYTFTTSETVANSRFEIVYRNAALNNLDFTTSKVNASIKNQAFNAAASLGMTQIEIYDIAGRLVMSFNAEGQNNTTKAFNHADGVYIAKIKLENGSIATQKLINQK